MSFDTLGTILYYAIFLSTLSWIYFAIQAIQPRNLILKNIWIENRVPIAIALGTTFLVFLAVPARFHVQSDEADLLGVSRSMLYAKSALQSAMGLNYFGTMNIVVFEFNKRPVLFPFLLHLLHIIRGYDYHNAFLLNGILLFAFLLLVVKQIYRKSGVQIAAGTALLLCSTPLLTLCASSGGFELLALFVWAGSLALLRRYWENPTSRNWNFLLATLTLLAYSRYESGLQVIIFVLGVLFFCTGSWKNLFQNPLSLVLSILWMVPLLLQQLLAPAGSFENKTGVAVFDLKNFIQFAPQWLHLQWDWSLIYPYPSIVHVITTLGLLVLFISAVISKKMKCRKFRINWILLGLVGLAAYFVLVCSYYFGDPAHPASARYFLPISAALAILPAWIHSKSPKIFPAALVLALGIFSAIYYLPSSAEQRFPHRGYGMREFELSWDFMKKYGDEHSLVIYDRPVQMVSLGYGSVDFDYANNNKNMIIEQMNNHLHSAVYAIQHIDLRTKKAEANCMIDPAFDLVPIQELQLNEIDSMRLSRVNLKDSAPKK